MKKALSLLLSLIMLCSVMFGLNINSYAVSGSEIVAYARQFIGYPYVKGTQGPNSFDCVGFAKYVFGHFGISLPFSTETIWNNPTQYGTIVATGSVSNAQAGDLISWSGHVAIYTENGYCVEALNSKYGVCEKFKVDVHTNGLNYRVLRIYGVSNAVATAAPKTASLSINKQDLKIGESFTFNMNADQPTTYYWFTIVRANTGEVIISEKVYGIYTTSFLSCDHYYAWCSAANQFGSVDSNGVDFYVYGGAPTEGYITANKDNVALGESIEFSFSSNAYYTKNYVSIFDPNGDICFEGWKDQAFSYTPKMTGKYTAHATLTTPDGNLDTPWISFVVESGSYSWETPTYKWSSDNKTCTATRVCTNDSSKTEIETVNALSSTVTSAGCESSGKVKYTATFSNSAFTTQTKTVTVPSTGHSWGTPTYKWSSDNKTCTATRTCTRDSSHIETQTVNTTSQVIKQPTTTATGTRKFTATFTNSAFTTQTKNVSIPKLNEPVDDDIYFPDVSENSWYYDAVQYVAKAGFMSGYQNGNFGPGDNLKRQDFVVILANIADVNLSSYASMTPRLKDVKKGAYYAAAVNWAVDNNIIAGYANGNFGVNDPITREQVATILYRYMDEPSVSGANSILAKFSDSGRISSFAKTPVAWAVQNNIISGMADGRVAPTEGASRAQIASIIMRMDQKGMF